MRINGIFWILFFVAVSTAYGQQPVGDRPAPPGDQPAPPADQPVPPGDQPAPPGDQPAPSGDQPAPPGDRPAEEADRPSEEAGRPADETDRPAEEGDRPAEETGMPADDQGALPLGGYPAGGEPVSGTTILNTYYSGIEQPRLAVVRSQSAWEALWADIHSDDEPFPDPIGVDFDTQMIVVAALGSRSSSGYSVDILGVIPTEDGFEVDVLESRPGERCVVNDAESAPVVVVAVPALPGTPVFVESSAVQDCD